MKVTIDRFKVTVENKGKFTYYELPQDDPSGIAEIIAQIVQRVSQLGTASNFDTGLNSGQIPVIGVNGYLDGSVIDIQGALSNSEVIINGGGA